MARRSSDGLRHLFFEESSWPEALIEPSVLRRRLIVAELLAPALTLRKDPRDLRMPVARAERDR